jgi:NAD(P)-dependent dehydrogenase (short-subunit alcohol dehydrogenase family)
MASNGSLFERGPELVALVTGAASGIGAATVTRLAREGIGGLVLLDRDGAGLQAQAQALGLTEARLLVRAQDVVDEAGWDTTATQIAERFGRLDLAVVNAGVAGGGTIVDRPFAEWRHILATNLDGAFLTLRASMRLMQQGQRGGAIVVVASAAAVKAEIGTSAYGASKAGVVQLARVAAKEGASDRIRVNSILPGGVITPLWRTVPFFQDLVAQHGSEEAAFAAMAAMATPLGRYATADEVAEQIVWLLSDHSAAMTGSAILLDGGYAL